MNTLGVVKKTRVNVALPASLVVRMDARARRAGISRADFIRRAITDHCRLLEADEDRQQVDGREETS